MLSVVADGVWKRLGGRWVLRGVSFEARSGAVTVVLGPNGAGKTTLLRSLSGIYRVERGRVLLGGLEPRRAVSRGLVAFAPDELGLYPRLTGREHLELVSRLYGRVWSGVEEAVEKLGLTDALDRKVDEYSRGMRRKLAMLMALASGAPILLLDEPLSGLDIVSVYNAVDILKSLAHGEERTVIVTTHEVWIADKLADSLVILEEGRVAAWGDRDELMKRYEAGSIEELLFKIVRAYRETR